MVKLLERLPDQQTAINDLLSKVPLVCRGFGEAVFELGSDKAQLFRLDFQFLGSFFILRYNQIAAANLETPRAILLHDWNNEPMPALESIPSRNIVPAAVASQRTTATAPAATAPAATAPAATAPAATAPAATAPAATAPQSKATLIYVSMSWPRPATIELSVFESDTVSRVLEKIKLKEQHKAQGARRENVFAALDMVQSFDLWFHDDNAAAFKQLHPTQELSWYSFLRDLFVSMRTKSTAYMHLYMTRRSLDDMFSDDDELERRGFVATATAPVRAPAALAPAPAPAARAAVAAQSQSMPMQPPVLAPHLVATVPAGMSAERVRGVMYPSPPPAAAASSSSSSSSTDNNNLKRSHTEAFTGDDSDLGAEDFVIMAPAGTEGGLSLSDTKCPVTNATFTEAMRCKCAHRVDRAGLAIILNHIWKKEKKKTANCPQYGCSSKWTELTSKFDAPFQAAVNVAAAAFEAKEKLKNSQNTSQGSVGSKGREIIDLDDDSDGSNECSQL